MIKHVIRKDLPETNSSSSHSVVISLDPKGVIGESEWDLVIDENGNLHIPEFTGFGRDFFLTNSALTKLQYLSCYYIYGPFVCRGVISKRVNKLRAVLKDILGINGIVLDEFTEFHKRAESGDIEAAETPFYEYPVVDHESFDIFDEITESKETIKNFILNKNTWLYGGSDGFHGDPSIYVNTETLPRIIGCFSVDFGNEIGRVDVEVDEDLKELSEKLRFFDNFTYDEHLKKWTILKDSIFYGSISVIVDQGKLRLNIWENKIDMKFELYEYNIFSI